MQTIKIIYFNTNNLAISTHTYLKKETLSIKEIYIPAFYVGAKSFVIITKNFKKIPIKKIHAVGKLFEIKFLGCQKI